MRIYSYYFHTYAIMTSFFNLHSVKWLDVTLLAVRCPRIPKRSTLAVFTWFPNFLVATLRIQPFLTLTPR